MEFVKYHKRVTRNFTAELHELLDSSKQTMMKGITSNYRITLNYIRLNKSCTVVNAWWSLQILNPEMVSEEVRQLQYLREREWIEQEMQTRQNEIDKQDED